MIVYVDLNITINTIAAIMTPKCGAKLDMTDVTERWRKLTYKTDAIETGSGIFW